VGEGMRSIIVGMIFGTIIAVPILTLLYVFAHQLFITPVTVLVGFLGGWLGTDIAIKMGF